MSHPAIRDYLRAASDGESSDAALLERFGSSRDETAFELLVWRHAALVQRVCHGVLRDHHAAEDAAQAAFLVLARKGHTVRGSVVGWLYRVARRVALRLAKKRARLPVTAELDRVPTSAVECAAADEVEALCEAVAGLPERYRVPVLLCFFEGLTHTEAARRTGWPVGTVAGRLSRAKQLLARRLRKVAPVAPVALALPAGGFVGSTARAASAFALRGPVVPCVEPCVLSLAEGACRTMSFTATKAAALAAGLLVATATVWGVSKADGPQKKGIHPPPATPAFNAPLAAGDRLADAKQRARSVNNLKQILLAMHNYLDMHGTLPANVLDANGKPLLSWRVQLLPFLEGDNQYKMLKLDEPWDSATNKRVLGMMPDAYRVGFEPKGETKTHYQGFAGKNTVFEPGQALKIFSITDGTSNTLGVIEAAVPVEWTKPADIPYDPDQAVQWAGPFKNLVAAGAMDGAVYLFKPDLDDKTLHTIINRQDGIPGPPLERLKAKLPLTADEIKVAQDVLRANEKLIGDIGEQLREQQRLLVELGRLNNPKDSAKGLDLDRLVKLQSGLEQAIEQLKRETDGLRKEVKALEKK